MTLNQNTISGAITGSGTTTLTFTTILAIFGDYATHWTLLLSAIATFALVTNTVVNKRRGDRKEAREVAEYKKRMGDLSDKIEGTDNA